MMKRVIGLSLLVLCASASAGKNTKAKVKPSVTWAPSWAAAIEEARALNVPMVIHRHGFT